MKFAGIVPALLATALVVQAVPRPVGQPEDAGTSLYPRENTCSRWEGPHHHFGWNLLETVKNLFGRATYSPPHAPGAEIKAGNRLQLLNVALYSAILGNRTDIHCGQMVRHQLSVVLATEYAKCR